MAFVPTAARRRARSARTLIELVSNAAGYGALALAFAFTGALVLGFVP